MAKCNGTARNQKAAGSLAFEKPALLPGSNYRRTIGWSVGAVAADAPGVARQNDIHGPRGPSTDTCSSLLGRGKKQGLVDGNRWQGLVR